MPWTYIPPAGEFDRPFWFNTDTNEMSLNDPTLVPSAENLWGWNPNMSVPEGGFTVGQALAPNYLSQGTTLDDPAALAAAVRDVAPGYNGPLDMNAVIPPDQMRAPAADNGFENLLGAAAMAGLGYLSGGFGIPELWGNMFGSPTTITSASGGMPTQVGGWSGDMPDLADWWAQDSSVLQDDWLNKYNATSGNTVNLQDYYDYADAAQSATNGVTAPSPTVSIPGYGDVYGTPSTILKSLIGSGIDPFKAASALKAALSGDSSILGSLLSGITGSANGIFGGGLFDRVAAAAPVLAAIKYARDQNPFDTSRLESLYDSYDPSKLAYEYDLNTGRGRDQLSSSLQNRGVMGSSFGNMDITNFNTTRELGRQSLINQGIGQRGQIASNILDAEVKGRQLKNQLYGSSLLALGNVFGGRSSPTINFGGI